MLFVHKHHPLVAALAREGDALLDEDAPRTVAARAGVDEEEAELGDVLRIADAIDRPDALTVQLGDPGGLAVGIVLLEVLGDHASDQRGEGLAPALLVLVEVGVPLEHPAVVAEFGLADLYALIADLANKQHLRVLRQRPEVVGDDLLQLVGRLADLGHRRDLLVAGVHRQLHALEPVRVRVGLLELLERRDELVDQAESSPR